MFKLLVDDDGIQYLSDSKKKKWETANISMEIVVSQNLDESFANFCEIDCRLLVRWITPQNLPLLNIQWQFACKVSINLPVVDDNQFNDFAKRSISPAYLLVVKEHTRQRIFLYLQIIVIHQRLYPRHNWTELR